MNIFPLLLKSVFLLDSLRNVCTLCDTIHCNTMLLWDVCIVIGCVHITWCLSRTGLYLTALSGLRFQCGITTVADLLSLVAPDFPHSHTAPTCLTALYTHITCIICTIQFTKKIIWPVTLKFSRGRKEWHMHWDFISLWIGSVPGEDGITPGHHVEIILLEKSSGISSYCPLKYLGNNYSLSNIHL